MIRKTALITGSARRIGMAFSRHLARKGWSLALHFHTSEDAARHLQRELKEEFPEGKFEIFRCDLNDANAVGSLISEVLKSFGNLHLLINNASVFDPGTIKETSLELLCRQMDVNFRAPFLLIRDYVNQCDNGLVVNLLDTRIKVNNFSHSAYSLSKKALAELTQMAALEFGPGFRVNGIAPGATLAPKGESEEYLKRIAAKTPMRLPGGTGPILTSLDYILENSNLTGQILFCDGGEHLL